MLGLFHLSRGKRHKIARVLLMPISGDQKRVFTFSLGLIYMFLNSVTDSVQH